MSKAAPPPRPAPIPATARIAVVAARFNSEIVDELLSGCLARLAALNVDDARIELHRVPGAFELPLAAKLLAESDRFAAVICVGCVIRGQTPHFDFVAGQCAAGIARASLETRKPIIFGVLTTNTIAQAKARAGGDHGHAGIRAADAAVEMIALVNKIAPPPRAARPRKNGFTFIELLTTVAVLAVLFGIMLPVSHYVRDRSAQDLTSSILARLEQALADYRTDFHAIPAVPPLIPSARLPDEAQLRRNALANNQGFVRCLRQYLVRQSHPGESTANFLDQLPLETYDEVTLCDAWGAPIVFMPQMHQAIGMAPPTRPFFFFSAGPDGKYLTRDDNLYSYELDRTHPPP